MLANLDRWDPFSGAEPTSRGSTAERQVFIENARNLNTEVRESVSRAIRSVLPRPFTRMAEAAFTWMSGCPHEGQQPLYRRTKVLCTIEAFVGFALAVALGYAFVEWGLWYLLPISWILVVGRMWALFNIFHHATHKTLFESERLNRTLAFASSLVMFASSLDSYRDEHIRSHHTRAMCTYQDQEAPFMPLGFRPGLTSHYYRWRLIWLIATPWTYLQYTRYRLWDWQRSEPIARQLAVWTFAVALIALAALTGHSSTSRSPTLFQCF